MDKSDILVDILEKKFRRFKTVKNSWKCKKKTHNNIIRSIINILKLFY